VQLVHLLDGWPLLAEQQDVEVQALLSQGDFVPALQEYLLSLVLLVQPMHLLVYFVQLVHSLDDWPLLAVQAGVEAWALPLLSQDDFALLQAPLLDDWLLLVE